MNILQRQATARKSSLSLLSLGFIFNSIASSVHVTFSTSSANAICSSVSLFRCQSATQSLVSMTLRKRKLMLLLAALLHLKDHSLLAQDTRLQSRMTASTVTSSSKYESVQGLQQKSLATPCTGVCISPQCILSVAHCVRKRGDIALDFIGENSTARLFVHRSTMLMNLVDTKASLMIFV